MHQEFKNYKGNLQGALVVKLYTLVKFIEKFSIRIHLTEL